MKFNNRILVTGNAGFIGFHTTVKLLMLGYNVFGLDNLNNYYDQSLKKDRLNNTLKISKKAKGKFTFIKHDINNYKKLEKIFKKNKFYCVIHFAAQAGIRYSKKNPRKYFETNLLGFGNILENSRKFGVKHLIFASSSSVYGMSHIVPYSEKFSDSDHPLQLYAASKRSNEIIAHSYSYLYQMKITGLRFFTVYGPWGRPDMALFDFTKKILEKKKIKVFNKGNHFRDFTYIDDVVDGVLKAAFRSKNTQKFQFNKNRIFDPSSSKCDFEIYNIGNGKPIKLINFINMIEQNLKIKAKKVFLKKQTEDMEKTYCNSYKAKKNLNFNSKTTITSGIKKFIDWYLLYYKKN